MLCAIVPIMYIPLTQFATTIFITSGILSIIFFPSIIEWLSYHEDLKYNWDEEFHNDRKQLMKDCDNYDG